MATSGTITFGLNARQVITRALNLIGVLGSGQAVSADDASLALDHLNMMLKSFQADGCNLWRELEDEVVFASNASIATLDPRVIDVMEARVVLENDYERALARWENGEYQALPIKTAAGDPVVFNVVKNRGSTQMRVWMVPTVSRTIKYTAARVIEDVGALDDELDIPQEWLECAVYNLAARLCEPFEVTQNNPNVVARVQQRADALYAQMRDADRPASVFLQPY